MTQPPDAPDFLPPGAQPEDLGPDTASLQARPTRGGRGNPRQEPLPSDGRTEDSVRPAPRPYQPRPTKSPLVTGSSFRLILAASVLGVALVVALVLRLLPTDRGGSTPEPPPPTSPSASPTAEWDRLRAINPGFEPGRLTGPFAEPRASRPPVAAPTATPKQEWPDVEAPVEKIAQWKPVDGEAFGLYQIPSTWEYREGLMTGNENARGIVIGRVVSYDRDKQCQGHQWSKVMLLEPLRNVKDLAAMTRNEVWNWAQMRNTEYEGDYYAVPEPKVTPFEFADGAKGTLATVSFVPMYPDPYTCNTAAIRYTIVSRIDRGRAYRMIAVSHIGTDESLPVATERQILATLTTG